MKIVLANHFPLEGSGSGIYTKNLAMELAKRGNEVLVILPDNEEYTHPMFETKTIIFSNGMNENCDLNFNFPCFTTHPKSNKTYYELNEEQIQAYIDAYKMAFKEVIEEFKPDIIHCQHLWITPYVASLYDIPYVVTAHGTDLKGFYKDSRYHKYALEGAKNADKIITISKQVDSEVKKHYKVSDINTKLILNGFDEDIFRVKDLNRKDVLESLNLKKDYKHVVSFVGKLAEFKGVDVLIRSAKIYKNHLEDVATLIVGNGQLYGPLVNLTKELELEDVYFLGHQNQDIVADIYNIADVSVVPSRVEPFGLVAIEALACGTPVIATNQGGLPDFIDDSIGSLVPVDDDIALGNAIVKEILNENREQKGKKAAKIALDGFSWKRVLDDVVLLYEESIKNHQMV